MNGEIICVGTELLLGNIVNTNARYLSEELASLGINVYNQSVVGDNEIRIKNELGAAIKHSQLIILTGGLGPTADDMTKECVASFFSLPLVEDAESRQRIEEYFNRTGRTMVASNYKQALLPKGSYILKNDIGTAPGCIIEHGGNTVVILPGPPAEMEHMFSKYVKPYIENKSKDVIVSHKVRIIGESESKVEAQIKHLTKLKNPTVAPYANEGELFLRVTAKAGSTLAANTLCTPVINSITETLGDCVYGVDVENIQTAVVNLLKEKKLKIATAESCTAGMLSSMITEVSGSSEIFEFGISAYANRVKVNALGVPEDIIAKYGAVSEHTAAYMAVGVRKLSGADIGIGITGVAGPGASESKPVGLVYIALADRHNIWVRKTTLGHGNSEREKVRRNSARTALDLVRRYICSLPETMEGGFPIGSTPKVLTEQPAILGVHHIDVKPAKSTQRATGTTFTDLELAQMISSVAQNDHYAPASKEDAEEYAKNQSDFLSLIDDDDLIPPRISIKERILSFLKKAPKEDINSEFLTEIVTEAENDIPEPVTIETGMILEPDEEEPTALDIKKAELPKEDTKKTLKERKPIIKNKVMGFLKSLLPWKGDKAGEIIRKLVFIVSLLALIASSLYMIGYFRESDAQNDIVESVREIYKEEITEKDDDGVFLSFEDVIKKNSDTKAWLTIGGTSVNNPVVLGKDNNFYLKHNFLKEKSRYGTLYFDAASRITAEGVSQNLVIYGHEMKDGSMFGTLKRYKNVNFYKQNPTLKMRTLYDDATYKIFSIFITNASPEQDNGFVFEYRTPDFLSQYNFLAFVSQLKERSIINTGVDVEEHDQIVTLSTCTGEFADARLVIVARRVREGESAKVDLKKVSVNPNPRYPQAYYDKKNIKNPYNFASSDLPVSSIPEDTTASDTSSTDVSSDESLSSLPLSSDEDTAVSSDTASDDTSSDNQN